jgi:cytochrome c biogenesis protein
LNILACVVHGLPQALRRASQRLTWETALTLPERGRLSWPAGVDPHPEAVTTLNREMGRCQRETLPEQTIYFGEQGRWRPLGPYLIHVALLLILAGGLIGKFWGVDGQLPLDQGEVAEVFRLANRTETPLKFQVRLDQFHVTYYDQGSIPKEFRSDLTFLQDGREVAQAVCRVNEPVTFGGYTFYQSSYGSQAAGPIRLKVHLGDQTQTLEMPFRQPMPLPGNQGVIIPMRVDGNYQGYGPAVLLGFSPGAGHPVAFWVLQDHPEMGQQPGPYRFTVEAIPLKFFSVFQVKRDPGVWWVYAGFLLFFPGFYLAFFRPAQRWALVLEKTPKGGWKGRLLGASPRHREEFAARLEELLSELKRGNPS